MLNDISGEHDGFLLGDSGYPCKSYLMTPFLHPETQNQENFNDSLCRTRVLIEQTYGILKKRFPILHFGVRAEPDMAVNHISSCVTLHNIGIIHGDIVPAEDIIVINVDGVNNVHIDIDKTEQGNVIRQQIADRFFAQIDYLKVLCVKLLKSHYLLYIYIRNIIDLYNMKYSLSFEVLQNMSNSAFITVLNYT